MVFIRANPKKLLKLISYEVQEYKGSLLRKKYTKSRQQFHKIYTKQIKLFRTNFMKHVNLS